MRNKHWRFERALYPGLYIIRENKNYLKKSRQFYEEGAFFESMLFLLDAVDPDIRMKFANKWQNQFSIPHFNNVVEVSLGERGISISTFFRFLPGEDATTILNASKEEKFTTLSLLRLQSGGSELLLQCHIEYIHTNPDKIKRTLERIGRLIYKYRNRANQSLFADQIYAKGHVGFKVISANKIWSLVSLFIDESFSEETETVDSISWYIVLLSILKIEYFCSPKGNTGCLLDEAKQVMNSKVVLGEQIVFGRQVLQTIRERGQSALIDDMPQFDVVLPVKEEAEVFYLQRSFFDFFKMVQDIYSAGAYDSVVRMVTVYLLNILDKRVLPGHIYSFIVGALEASSGKPWVEGAMELYKAINMLHARKAGFLME